MADWDCRVMFDRYLYDYMRKNNMHETAEIFKREANVIDDPTVPLAIDVHDGFLHEWWLVFYDMFKSRQQGNHDPREGPSDTMMSSGQQSNASLARQNEMNERTIRHLLNNTDLRGSSVQSIGWPFTGTGRISPGFSSVPHQQELLASTSVWYPPVNFSNSMGQEASSSSVNAVSRMANIASNESGRERSNQSDSEAESSSMLEVTDFASEDSLTYNKSSDVKVNSSSSHIDHNKGDTSASSSNMQRCSATADASIVHQVLKSKKER